MGNRLTTDELVNQIPEWCIPGQLVWVDNCYLECESGKEKVGIVLNNWIIDVEQVDDDDYNYMMTHDEWLIFDVLVEDSLVEGVYIYGIEKFITKENLNAKN